MRAECLLFLHQIFTLSLYKRILESQVCSVRLRQSCSPLLTRHVLKKKPSLIKQFYISVTSESLVGTCLKWRFWNINSQDAEAVGLGWGLGIRFFNKGLIKSVNLIICLSKQVISVWCWKKQIGSLRSLLNPNKYCSLQLILYPGLCQVGGGDLWGGLALLISFSPAPFQVTPKNV